MQILDALLWRLLCVFPLHLFFLLPKGAVECVVFIPRSWKFQLSNLGVETGHYG
jgi:hypothetical protein